MRVRENGTYGGNWVKQYRDMWVIEGHLDYVARMSIMDRSRIVRPVSVQPRALFRLDRAVAVAAMSIPSR